MTEMRRYGLHVNAEGAEVGEELVLGAEDEGGEAEAGGGIGEGGNIVNIDRLGGGDAASLEGFAVDEGIWFGGADAARVDAGRGVGLLR